MYNSDAAASILGEAIIFISVKRKLTYKIDLLSVKVFREEGCPSENVTAFILRNLVKLGANQEQRNGILSKLLSVVVSEGRREGPYSPVSNNIEEKNTRAKNMLTH